MSNEAGLVGDEAVRGRGLSCEEEYVMSIESLRAVPCMVAVPLAFQ